MTRRTYILIIGIGVAGFTATLTSSSLYPDKSVAVVAKDPVPQVPCGIPYVFHSLPGIEANMMGVKGLVKRGVEIVFDTVVGIDRRNKTVELEKR